MNKVKIKSVFAIFLVLFFLNIRSGLGMEASSTTYSTTTPPSPTKIETTVTNYCKEIINAFNANNLNEVKRLWYDFFNNIRYTIKISSRNPEDSKKLQLATFYCLAHCLATNATEPVKIYINEKDDLIYLALQNKNNNYILQFRAIEDSILLHNPIRKYILTNNNLYTVIGIDIHPFGISCNKVLNDYELYTQVTPSTLEYKDTNFFKNLVREGFVLHNVKQFCEMLSIIYNNISPYWRVDTEKFYQSILAWILIFMGNAKTMPEEATARGRIDITVTTPQFTNVVEFKLNGKAEKALQQIIDKGYAQTVSVPNKKTVLIGINVDTKHGDKILVTSALAEYIPVAPSPLKTPKAHKGKKRKKTEPSQEITDTATDVFSLSK